MRALRVAKGLMHPRTRGEYVAKIKDRVASRTATCRVCGAQEVRIRTLTHARKRRTLRVEKCRKCGHVAAPGNFHDYATYTSTAGFALTPRVGTDERPGREYHMAKLAASTFDRINLQVLVCGPGRSVDYRWIAKLDGVGRVAIADLMKLYDDADWVDLNVDAKERFDIVLACEVVEHFTDPVNDFAKLFSYVGDDGLVVCSTNVHDGGELAKHDYLFIRGHTSYYSPRSLVSLARANGMYVDFRVPAVAFMNVGPRKRYVIFSKSLERLQRLAPYFGDHVFAPSETVPPKTPSGTAPPKTPSQTALPKTPSEPVPPKTK